jgi:hypothetical protein
MLILKSGVYLGVEAAVTWGNAQSPRQSSRSGAVPDEQGLCGMTSIAVLGVQCYGDAELTSFGMSAAPDGQPAFDVDDLHDLNDLDDLDDLDELLPAWFEWEVRWQEAQESVLVPYAGPGEDKHQGEPVATEQPMSQAAIDASPSWTEGIAADGKDGQDGYLGKHGEYAVADIAAACADRNAASYQRLTVAVATGLLNSVLGPLTANPQPPLTGPLLRQGRRGRGRDGAASV